MHEKPVHSIEVGFVLVAAGRIAVEIHRSARCCVGRRRAGGSVPRDCAFLEAWQEVAWPQPPREAVIQWCRTGSPDQPETVESSALASTASPQEKQINSWTFHMYYWRRFFFLFLHFLFFFKKTVSHSKICDVNDLPISSTSTCICGSLQSGISDAWASLAQTQKFKLSETCDGREKQDLSFTDKLVQS